MSFYKMKLIVGLSCLLKYGRVRDRIVVHMDLLKSSCSLWCAELLT